MQTDIFNSHQHENNMASERHLNENRLHFSSQVRHVFEMLTSGAQITVYKALTEENIASLPRRILDLKQKGFKISDRWDDKAKTKVKIWFMTNEQIQFNKNYHESNNRKGITDNEIIGFKENCRQQCEAQ